jgi:beta-glucanase (GH16 family)
LYSSGKVKSEGKFSFLYGRVDVRAKLPGTQGLWPAIWMLPADDTWPPEIDVMELLGNDPTRVYMTLHWGTRKKQQHYQAKFDGPDFTADYHVFSIVWDPGQIHWLVDGIERATAVKNVPDRSMFLLLNTSIGGEWPGPPDRDTVLPQYFLIDYVRVYKRAG